MTDAISRYRQGATVLAAFARILLRRLVFEDGLLAAGAADEAAAPLLPLLLCQPATFQVRPHTIYGGPHIIIIILISIIHATTAPWSSLALRSMD